MELLKPWSNRARARTHTHTQEEDDEKKEVQIQVFVDKAKVWLPFETLFFKACVTGTSRADLKIDDFGTLSLIWRLKLIWKVESKHVLILANG